MPLLNSAFSRKATFFMCFGPLRLPGFFSTPGGITTATDEAASEDEPPRKEDPVEEVALAEEATEDGGGL